MGVEKNLESSYNKNNKNIIEKYRPPALRKTAELTDFELTNNLPNKISDSLENSNETIKSPIKSSSVRSEKRERRPDRAVYVPRARRSEINNPQTITISLPSSSAASINNKSADDKSYNQKRTTLKDNNLPQFLKNSSENDKNLITNLLSTTTLSNSVITNKNCDKKEILKKNKTQSEQIEEEKQTPATILTANSINLDNTCDSFKKNNQNFVNSISTNLNTSKKIMNLNNETNNLTDHNTDNNNSVMRIEDDNRSPRLLKKDQEIDELQRASKEINRSNRRIMKQTFNSDVLEIPEKINQLKSDNDDFLKKVDPENDDWDTIYDDNGECFDPKIIAELTASVGKVKIETPKADYSAYLLKQAILGEEEFPHVLEISNFPVEFKTQDLIMIFSVYKESGFDIKWVDDTHALAVFSSSRIAAEVLAMGHPFVKLKPLAEATIESRTKAKKCSSSLQPYRPRPETCAALARRLVTGALGVRLKTAAEERENEKRVLKEAKERKLLAAKQRDEVWES